MWPFKKKAMYSREKQILTSAKSHLDGKGTTLQILPPEGVPLDFPLAKLGTRIGAQIIDFFVTLFAAILILYLISLAIPTRSFFSFSYLISVIFNLVFFLIRVPYYILVELAWNGQTLAKRWLGIRVVSAAGRSLTPHQIVSRNIMKEVEFFAPIIYLLFGQSIHWSLTAIAFGWIIILFIVLWRSKRKQRIGDFIADTVVIINPKPTLLPELAGSAPSFDRFVFTTQQLDHYGRLELQVLEQVLRAPPVRGLKAQQKQTQYETDIVDRITRKVSYPETISTTDQREFLSNFYTAQRAHLENRQLFGDARDDKFFNEKETGS